MLFFEILIDKCTIGFSNLEKFSFIWLQITFSKTLNIRHNRNIILQLQSKVNLATLQESRNFQR